MNIFNYRNLKNRFGLSNRGCILQAGTAGTAGTAEAAGTVGTAGTAGTAGTVGTVGTAGTVPASFIILVILFPIWIYFSKLFRYAVFFFVIPAIKLSIVFKYSCHV